MKHNKWPVGIASTVLVVLAVGGIALASGQEGTAADPLVSLSYLTEVVTPSVLEEVDTLIAEDQSRLEEQLETVAQAYLAQLEGVAQSTGGTASDLASYQVVTLTEGQTMVMDVGCEVLLRSGTGTCQATATPGLVNMTSGTLLDNGQALVENQLYLTTIAGHGVTAQSAVTVLVRGDYTIQ